MKFFTRAILLLMIFQLSHCLGRLKLCNRDKVLKSVVRRIVRQNNLKGFLACNLIKREKNPIVFTKTKQLLKELSTFTTVVQINHSKHLELKKFHLNTTRFNRRIFPIDISHIDDKLLHYHVVTSDTFYPVLIVNFAAAPSMTKVILNIFNLCHSFSSVHGVSKTLLVTFVDKPRDYGKLFKAFSTAINYINKIDVLEIVTSRQLAYRVVQFDIFTKTRRISKYSDDDDKVQFFVNSMDLRGLKLYFRPYKPFDKSTELSREEKPFYERIYELPLATAARQLNGSFKSAFNKDCMDCYFLMYPMPYFYRQMLPLHLTLLHPAAPLFNYYTVPTLYDVTERQSFIGTIVNLLVIAFIITFFQLFGRGFHFDRRTMDSLATMSMIIGVPNPRSPTRSGETVAFVTLLAIGFFFGGNLIGGLFSVNFQQKVERKIDSASDVVRNNVTFMYTQAEETVALAGVPNVKWACGVNKTDWDTYKNLFLYKNESVPDVMAIVGLTSPRRVSINMEVHARQSSVKHLTSLNLAWSVPRNCPWLRPMERNLRRFYETRLSFHAKLLHSHRSAKLLDVIYNQAERLRSKIMEEWEDVIEDLGDLWLLILIGHSAAFLTLAVEMSYRKHRLPRK